MDELNLDLKELIGKNISEYRKIANLSQIELAEKLNYSDKAISKWERGESLPDVIVLKQIADFFGITLNDLVSTQKKPNAKASLKKFLGNKILITLLSVGLVWLVATIVFVLFRILHILPAHAWLSFIYALPASFIICIVFTATFFGKQKNTPLLLAIFESLLVWTIVLSLCLSLNFDGIWLLLIIAVPMQALIVMWNILSNKRRKQK